MFSSHLFMLLGPSLMDGQSIGHSRSTMRVRPSHKPQGPSVLEHLNVRLLAHMGRHDRPMKLLFAALAAQSFVSFPASGQHSSRARPSCDSIGLKGITSSERIKYGIEEEERWKKRYSIHRGKTTFPEYNSTNITWQMTT